MKFFGFSTLKDAFSAAKKLLQDKLLQETDEKISKKKQIEEKTLRVPARKKTAKKLLHNKPLQETDKKTIKKKQLKEQIEEKVQSAPSQENVAKIVRERYKIRHTERRYSRRVDLGRSQITSVLRNEPVYVGIDFGTSFTKAYFLSTYTGERQEGFVKLNEEVEGHDQFFLPSVLFYDKKECRLFFHARKDTEVIRYFKYAMIEPVLRNKNLKTFRGKTSRKSFEFLCSVYYMACVISFVSHKVSEQIKKDIKMVDFRFNMGCPIENWNDSKKDIYTDVLRLAYCLSKENLDEGMTLDEIDAFCKINESLPLSPKLQTIPELYAEASDFIYAPTTRDGLYTILDVGGGTVDFAIVLITRSEENGKVVKFISQNVMPLGVEVLLKKLHADLSAEEYEIEKKRLKDENPIIKYVSNFSSLKDPKEVLPYKFRIGFFQKIQDAKRVCCVQMDQLYDKGRGIFPLYVYGGGSDYRWYDAIVGEQNRHILKCNIPP